jgi:hypothetical protein
LDILAYAGGGGGSPYLAAEDLAIYEVVQWFIKVDEVLSADNYRKDAGGIVKLLETRFRGGKLDRAFSLP